MQLVLSIFTGIGLLDKAFKETDFCVVVWSLQAVQNITIFHVGRGNREINKNGK